MSHWSKDFVEHLRTVHFALVLVTLVLIVTALDYESARLSEALIQIQQINSFRKQWRDVPAKVYEALLDRNGLPSFFNINLRTRTEYFDYQVDGLSDTDDFYRFDVSRFGHMDREEVFPKELTTLADFRNFWNRLHGHPLARFVVEPQLTAECSVRTGSYYLYYRYQPCSLFDPDTLHIERANSSFGVDGKATIIENGLGQTELILDNFTTRPRHDFSNVEITVGLDAVVKSFNEDVLRTLYFPNAASGTFSQVFPQLDSISSDIAVVPLDEAVARLASRSASAEKNISLLGFSVPISQLSQWGILVVLAVQFYLWLHLHELSKRINPEAEGWDVAWIGVYRTRAAFWTSAISFLVLPVIATSTLGNRFSLLSHQYRKSVIAICALTVLISAGLGFLTLWRLMKLRQILPAEPVPYSDGI